MTTDRKVLQRAAVAVLDMLEARCVQLQIQHALHNSVHQDRQFFVEPTDVDLHVRVGESRKTRNDVQK